MEKPDAARPETPFEAASYDLKKFRERRIADRRFVPRDSADRRAAKSQREAAPQPGPDTADGPATAA